jgi:hypothetical protein
MGAVWNRMCTIPVLLNETSTPGESTVKKLIYTTAILITTTVGLYSSQANAQYYGANNSTWNNPMSASADIIIQQNMERERLKKSLAKKRPTRKAHSISSKSRSNARARKSSTRHTVTYKKKALRDR